MRHTQTATSVVLGCEREKQEAGGDEGTCSPPSPSSPFLSATFKEENLVSHNLNMFNLWGFAPSVQKSDVALRFIILPG